jgi:hypothetical protein
MATAHKPPIRRRATPREDAPDAPDATEEADVEEDDQDAEETADADAGAEDKAPEDDSGHPAEPHDYPPVEKNGEPKGVYILDGDDEIKESWFEKSEDNSELVVPKKTILKKVYAVNTVTPSYVQLAVEGVAMTKQAAAGLGKY